MTQHERWMEYALREAEKAFDQNEVPVGCVIVKGNKIIGKGYNQNETLRDPTAHAEIIAITAAAAQLQSKVLEECTLYVTLEPCPMCAGALVLARMQTVVFGVYDPKAGACGTLYTITEDKRLNHRVQTVGGVLDEKCSELLRDFFAMKRSGGNGDSIVSRK
jgi:tRNA(adenine34) deaminase